MQHRRVIGVIKRRHLAIVTVHREQILGEIIGADGKKIHPLSQCPGLIYRRRHFDHHAHRRHGHIQPFITHFQPGTVNQVLRFFRLDHAGDHGQHDAQIIQPLTGLNHGAHLHHENFRVVQGDTNTAPAQEGVFIFNREIAQGFIAADIQGAHGHRMRSKCRQLLAVNHPLLFFRRETVADHKRNFRPVQAHPFGTPLQ